MRAGLMGAALASALALAGTAAAQDAACDGGDKKPKVMKLRSGDSVADMTLQIMLPTALAGEDLDSEKITALPRTCARGTFDQGGRTYGVFGSAQNAPARWAASEAGGPIVYLVRLDYDMRALNSGYRKNGWMMVVQEGEKARIVRAYKSLPGDEALRTEFRDALAGKFPPVVGYDRKEKGIEIFM